MRALSVLPRLALVVALAAACVSERRVPPRSPDGDLAAGAIRMAPPPGAEVRALDALTGDWRVEVRRPGDDGLLAHGVARIEWSAGGRFVRWEVELESGGLRAPSVGLFGHDVQADEYQWAWASGWTGRLSVARGRGDLAGAGLRLVSQESDPVTGALARSRSILRLDDGGRLHLTQELETAPGAWRPTTLTVYARREPEAH